jgi:hypothetical protein
MSTGGRCQAPSSATPAGTPANQGRAALQDLFMMQAKALQEVAQGFLSALGHDDASKMAAAAF